MRKIPCFAAACALLSCIVAGAQSSESLLMNWEFSQPGKSPVQVTIPHDWAISGPFDREIDRQVVAITQNGETEATEKTGRSGSLPWIGEGRYATTLHIPSGYAHAELVFDGAMSEPEVYVDGVLAGSWSYGYSTFKIDVTPLLKRDRSVRGGLIPADYQLEVRLKNVEESSRWYPGAGLYRPVRLLLSQEAGLQTWGLFARTTRLDGVSQDATTASSARLTVSAQLRNDGPEGREFRIEHKLYDFDNQCVASVVTNAGPALCTEQVLVVKDARLWSPEHPELYRLETSVYVRNSEDSADSWQVIDRQSLETGIRVAVVQNEGFVLNGQVRKIRGVCLHHDLGPLGAAFNKAAFRRQVRLLKEIGCDAIRTSHNMPAPWQMDICDEMGMMVMAESCDMWVYPKCRNGYSRFFEQWWERDFTNLVLVNRNHPSIIMWSIGNEIPDQGNADGLRYTRAIQDLIHRLDPTRPCTQGVDQPDAAIWSGVLQASDVPGLNYRTHRYEAALANSPSGIVLGSETCSTISSRGVYKFPVEENYGDAYDDGQVSSYDLECCIWSNLPDDDWMWQDKAPWMIGEFVWTGFDYLGEPTPYDEYWPSRSSYFGIYDLAGLPKDRAWLYRTHWAPERETLHLLPHWNWKGREGQVTPVFCYTSYPEAELFVNGRSQGRRRHIDVDLDTYKANMIEVPTPWGGTSKFADPNAPAGSNRLDRYRMRWMDVVYEPGELKVVAYDADGHVAATEIVRTAGKPHHLELVADRAALDATPLDSDGAPLDTPDLSFVTVRVVDKDGNLCPDADNQLIFKVKSNAGVARFNSACNGDATSLEVFTQPTMRAFHGQCVVVVEAGSVSGDAVLQVSAKGLKSASMPLTVTPVR